MAKGRLSFREDEGVDRISIYQLRMAMRERLCGRLHESDITMMALEAEKSADDSLCEELYLLMSDTDKRVSENAAWVLCHVGKRGNRWLQDRQEALIRASMETRSATQRRLILSILRKQRFEKEKIHTTFLDHCLEQILSPRQPVSIRSLSIYLAYEQCVHYPELLAELEETLRLLSQEALTPGLRHAQRETLRKIKLAKHGLSVNHK